MDWKNDSSDDLTIIVEPMSFQSRRHLFSATIVRLVHQSSKVIIKRTKSIMYNLDSMERITLLGYYNDEEEAAVVYARAVF